MIVLSGADLILPEQVLPHATLVIDGDRIVGIEAGRVDNLGGHTVLDVAGCLIAPGFIDVHVHGVEGHDALDGPEAVDEIARRLPRYGVTAFCPTSVACSPDSLRSLLRAVGSAQRSRGVHAARVLGAHLESNFINPDYKGAQPSGCLRTMKSPLAGPAPLAQDCGADARSLLEFSGQDVLDVIAGHRQAVGIVTLAPELEGGYDLIGQLVAAGHLVSIGHSGATYEQAISAIEAGVRHATHLFNRMSPLGHRAPGVAGAVLQSDRVCAELICDGFHVHPALIQLAVRAKGLDGIMAITDGTAGAGLPVGSRARLGTQTLLVTERTAVLEDGTLAGSVLTMDGAFRTLVRHAGMSLVSAARLCATSPARQLGLSETGRIGIGAMADLVVLGQDLRVRQTYLAGVPWRNTVSN